MVVRVGVVHLSPPAVRLSPQACRGGAGVSWTPP